MDPQVRLCGRGVWIGFKASSFLVHLPMSVLVIALAIVLRCALWEWCVFAALYWHGAICRDCQQRSEELAKGLCPR